MPAQIINVGQSYRQVMLDKSYLESGGPLSSMKGQTSFFLNTSVTTLLCVIFKETHHEANEVCVSVSVYLSVYLCVLIFYE